MSEETEVIFDTACYLESLVRMREPLKGTKLLNKLDLVIDAELDIALIGADKAKSKLVKANVRSIK